MSTRARSHCWLLAFMALSAGYGSRVWGQQEQIATGTDRWYFGYDMFQMLIEERGLRTVSRVDQILATPAESVLVVAIDLPRRISPQQWRAFAGFVDRGGALLVAFDSSSTRSRFGRFWRGPVESANSQNQYGGFTDCLSISRLSAAHMQGVSRLVTNRSGWFRPSAASGLSWEILATLPADCWPDEARRQPLIAMGRSRSSGLAIFSADASLFTNGMLWHGDNAIAAIRISEILCGGSKTQVAFWADGKVLASYRSRIGAPPDPEPETLPPLDRELPRPGLEAGLRLANAIAKEIADSNLLNQALMRQPRNVRRPAYFQAVLNFAAVLCLLGTVWMLLKNRTLRSILFAPRRLPAAFELRDYPGGLAHDYRDAAGYLCRDFCAEVTSSRDSATWQAFLAASLAAPSTFATGQRQELSRIVDIACRGCHKRLTARDFQLLGQSIEQLRIRLHEGSALAAGATDRVADQR